MLLLLRLPVVQLMDFTAVWFKNIVVFFSTRLLYVLYVSHKLISSCWVLALLICTFIS